MKLRFKSILRCLLLFVILGAGLPGTLPTQAQGNIQMPGMEHLKLGPPTLPVIPSLPLQPVTMPSRTGSPTIGAAQPSSSESMAPLAKRAPGARAMAAVQACSPVTVDLKVLVIVTDPTDTQTALPAIRQVLEYQGTPYTVFTASPRPADPAANRLASMLSSGCHGYFQGVILGNGQVAYNDPTAGFQSALTNPEWQSLWGYERTFSVRQVTWYTYPSSDYGFNPPSSSGDTTANPISAAYTSAGQTTFTYANTANPLTIQYVWAYRATPLDSNTTPLLQDSSGNALAAIRTYPDSTQNLALTFDSNANVTHNLVLAYGLVNWVTRGLFLGERHIFLTPQADDIFIDAHIWAEGTPCGSDTEKNHVTYRMTGSDLQAVINWQQSVQAQPTTQAFVLDIAFNGEGTTGTYNPDTLTPMARANQALFKWTNHTYTHADLNNASYDQTYTEITRNNQVAQDMGFTKYSIMNLITPGVSGLTNPNAMQAAFDAGVRYLVTDTSQPSYNNPTPNTGLYNQLQPGIFMLPRYPTNLYYNVTNPQQWTEEYNCIYITFWGRALTYQEILDNESKVLLKYVLTGDMDPWMFHETNLRAYDGSHTLLSDLFNPILAKYNNLFVLPVLSPTMNELSERMKSGTTYRAAGVTASIVPGQSITISSQQAAVVPVTGLNSAGAETYGGQFISHVSIGAGQTITLSLGNQSPTPTPTSSTPTQTATPPTAAPTFVPSTYTPAPGTPISTNTPVPPTNTPVPPTSTPIPPTNTPVPPTNTPVPPTNTPVPPTNTPVPPTNTPVPPTNTPVPPTSTPTRTPTPTNTPTRTPSPPVANNDAYTMSLLNVQLTVPAPGVLRNDTDADGNALTAVLVTSPSGGLLTFNADGSFTYTPTTSLTSFTDSFTYKAYDGALYSNVATVTIQVNVP
jgi:Bacterial Ig domain